MNYIDSGLKVVGTRPVRPDGVDKVTGRARFGADFAMPGQLVGFGSVTDQENAGLHL